MHLLSDVPWRRSPTRICDCSHLRYVSPNSIRGSWILLTKPIIFRFQREVLYETGGMLVHVFHDVISEKEIKVLKSRAKLQVCDSTTLTLCLQHLAIHIPVSSFNRPR